MTYPPVLSYVRQEISSGPLSGKRKPNLLGRFPKGSDGRDKDLADYPQAETRGGEATLRIGSTEGHALSKSELPNHTHTLEDPGHGHNLAHDAFWKEPGGAGERIILPKTGNFPAYGKVDGRAESRIIPVDKTYQIADNATTRITVTESGGGGQKHAHDIPEKLFEPPYESLHFIIRVS